MQLQYSSANSSAISAQKNPRFCPDFLFFESTRAVTPFDLPNPEKRESNITTFLNLKLADEALKICDQV